MSFSNIKNPIYKNTFIYACSDGITKALSFIVLPFISYYLVPEQLGIVANFDVLQSILMLLAGQAVVNALPYFYYERSKREVAILITNLFFIILIANILFSVVIFCSYGIIERYLSIGVSLQLLTIVSVLTTLLSSMSLILYRLEDKPYVFLKLQILQSVTQLTLLIYMVIYLRLEANGKIYSGVIAGCVLCCIHFILLYKRGYVILKYSKRDIMTLVRFGVPLLPHSLSFWIKGGMDKILLTTYCGLSANGLYSMAMSFGAIYSIFRTSFDNAYTPYLQKRISMMTPDNEKEEKRKFVRMSYKVGGVFLALYFIAVAFCWFAINYLLSDKYLDTFQFVPWILMSLTIYSFYSLVIQFPYTVKKTSGLGVITFFGSLIQLSLSYIFIRMFGVDGIKFSLVLGSLVIMLGVWWYSNKVYPLPWFGFQK